MPEGLNKKTIIQLIVILVAFGIAGVVLYNGFFKGNNNAALQSVSLNNSAQTPGGALPAGGIGGIAGASDVNTPSAQTSGEILPYGDTLDFSAAINPIRFQYDQIVYQKLDPKNDVGISPESLVIPASAASSGSSGTAGLKGP